MTKNKRNVTIFPYVNADLLPLIQYIDELNESLHLSYVISPNGVLTEGKDVAYLANKSPVGITVGNNLDVAMENSDILLIPPHPSYYSLTNDVYNAIENAILKSKDVIYYNEISKDKIEYFSDLSEKINVKFKPGFIERPIFETNNEITCMYTPTTPVIFIVGLTGDNDQLAVTTKLAVTLKRKGYKTATFVDSDILDMLGFYSYKSILESNISNCGKVKLINKWVEKASKTSDIIIIQTSGGLIRFNEFINNDFGVDTFLISQAVLPDYCLACFPYGAKYTQSFIDMISAYVKRHFDFNINCIHLSNRFININKSIERKKKSFISIDDNKLNKVLENSLDFSIPFLNCLSSSNLLEDIALFVQ